MAVADYTVEDLGNFVAKHNVDNLRMTYRKGVWEVNWQQKNGTRTQVEDSDFCTALAKFREEVAPDA